MTRTAEPLTRPYGRPYGRTLTIRARLGRALPRHRDARRVAELFGLDRAGPVGDPTLYDGLDVAIAPGEVVAVIGPSGAGKSVLLERIRRQAPAACVDAARLEHDRRPAIVAVDAPELSWSQRLGLVSRCGLAEARALVTPACRLSAGQRERLAVARALAAARRSSRPLLVADEFAARLDYLTGWVLARQVRKLATRLDVAMVLVTPRTELLPALRPDRVLVKALGAAAEVIDRPVWSAHAGPQWRIEPGRIGDYRALGGFHYLAGPPAAHKRVWIVRGDRLDPWAARSGLDPAGVLVVSPPVARCRGRNAVLPRRYTAGRAGLRRLNAEIECISRVVVHPSLRGLGLAVGLVRHALATAETPMIEALAAMGQVHPLFAKAGMYPFGRVAGRREYVYYLARRLPYTVAV